MASFKQGRLSQGLFSMVSQFVPSYPSGQKQKYSVGPIPMHSASFRHGLLSQAFWDFEGVGKNASRMKAENRVVDDLIIFFRNK